MNKDIFEGEWEEIKGQLREFWGKLTNDDLQEIKGNHEQLIGKLQKHYGYTKEEAKKALRDFLSVKRD
ncbi:CsbD family protein [Legionella londiniensis]|uniref:Stress response protein n=1 Tax=Legionella londiniensis TaxID=45068 RepID=A0A0W0VLS6_9GAMM|nr:CsbD family protein [Legionella londiniensis]KTD21093.1 stress response protein [Legionella londiniensis]STX93669.1 stress response protein [Legionella londiniensis]